MLDLIRRILPKPFKNIFRGFFYKLEAKLRKANRFPQGAILSADKFLQATIIGRKSNGFDINHDLHINKALAFDVGAFTGNSIHRIRSMGYSMIACFEPDPDNYSLLVNSYGAQEGLIFWNFAVSAKSGLELAMTSNRDLPWLNTLNQDWVHGTRHQGLFLRTENHTVLSISLDDVMKIHGAIPAYIKIDVEGHELSVLAGLKLKPNLLSFEWISERIDQNIVALECLEKLGFSRFYVCNQEELPDYDQAALNFEGCILRLKEIMRVDIDNDKWGNIFCL